MQGESMQRRYKAKRNTYGGRFGIAASRWARAGGQGGQSSPRFVTSTDQTPTFTTTLGFGEQNSPTAESEAATCMWGPSKATPHTSPFARMNRSNELTRAGSISTPNTDAGQVDSCVAEKMDDNNIALNTSRPL